MNLFTRIKDTISADFHDLLDKKERKNPTGLLNQYIRQCEKETEKVGQLAERQKILKDEFSRELEQAEYLAEKRKRQAVIAKQSSEMELAEFAVQESSYYEDRAEYLKQALDRTKLQQEELERKYEEMKRKLKDMHVKRLELMGRENMANANSRVNQVLHSESRSLQPADRFTELESYFERMEHQMNHSYNQHTIDTRIELLEKKNKEAETSLSLEK
ncbi:PspA/IM30 family protein [Bacillus massiliglaciei]|uniref:PspA/IM30 family protein n=1 Tax=Bacillus massiliglaciei TaxID=1816693 RepID=UPI000DA63923|nr:PspA/IM30 family protein [Bacillus massiliglaciei]